MEGPGAGAVGEGKGKLELEVSKESVARVSGCLAELLRSRTNIQKASRGSVASTNPY
jgi:hypothetical protein